MKIELPADWANLLSSEISRPYYKILMDFVSKAYKTNTCFPLEKDIFKAFELCPIDDLKIVILGQDPYHNENQANGLCFSVHKNIKLPPSLKNIYKELMDDMPNTRPINGCLEHWADQGVLLLNATLTVEAHQAGSHQNQGWETFTDAVINTISQQKTNVVFVLWGSYAQKKSNLIDESKHLILKSPHPSPLSSYRGFFGSKPFSKINTYLKENKMRTIKW